MALSKEEFKASHYGKSEKSPKPQLYIKDFYECDPDAKPRDIKNVANELVREGETDVLVFRFHHHVCPEESYKKRGRSRRYLNVFFRILYPGVEIHVSAPFFCPIAGIAFVV